MTGILPPDTIVEPGAGGVWYARSPHPLGPYPDKITERLEHWAQAAADRLFLVRRDTTGAWRGVTYAEALARVRALAQALINRGLSNDRPR